MDKHDILKKARTDKDDEREEQLENNSYKFGWFGATLIISLLMIFRFYQEQSFIDLALIVIAQIASRSFYFMLKEKDTYNTLSFLLALGGFIVVGLFFLIDYGVI